MRVALLTADWHSTGGVSTYVRLVSRELAAAGHEVLVIHSGPETASAGDVLPAGVSVRAVPGSLRPAPDDEMRTVGAVQRLVDAFAPDIVHFHASNNIPIEDALRAKTPSLKTLHIYVFCPAGTKYHHALDRPCVFPTGLMCVPRQVYLRCTLSRRPGVIWGQYRSTLRANAHHTTFGQLIVASEYVRQQAIGTGFDPGRVSVVPYFTDVPESVTPVSTQRVLYVGRVTRPKGADLFLDALAKVSGDVRGVIVGDGIDMSHVKSRARALGLEPRVEFPGWLNGRALDAEYERAAVVVVPSRLPEPFGITGIEAMAFGRPVVAFAVGGIPEWLEDGTGGFTVPPENVTDMAGRIDFLLKHPVEAAAIAARGRARVARDFTAAAHLAKLLPIYDRVIASR